MAMPIADIRAVKYDCLSQLLRYGLFIYLFIHLLLNAAQREKLFTKWAKHFSHWVTCFREWVALSVVTQL